LDQIDILEVLAEEADATGKNNWAALRSLARDCPITLHGTSLGLASTHKAEEDRLAMMARLCEAIRPEAWTEHLAFVRAGGIEIGHLAAPPRSEDSVEGTLENIASAAKRVGMAPELENIATLIDPPASSLDEGTWTNGIISQSPGGLLLDLHNLYANALNFGQDPLTLMLAMPLHKVSQVHLSGGHWVQAPGHDGPRSRRLLDDHFHDPPDAVYALLVALAERVPQRLSVILERDGDYPGMDQLLSQLALIRRALAQGRSQRNPA
jgi:uncharacterized protein (UPF0276 family)